jgi:prophage regulatory protein
VSITHIHSVPTAMFADNGERILRLPEVKQKVPLSTATIYARMRLGTFPRAINIGPRAVGWRLSQVNAWIEQQIAKSNGEAA